MNDQKWNQLVEANLEEETRQASFRLGQTTTWVMKPLVRLVDGTFGIDLEHCVGCGRRAARLDDFGDAVYNWITR